MANQNFQDLVADKFDYDSQAARDLLRTPWLDDHLASRAAAKAAREAEKTQKAVDDAQLAAPPEVPEDSSLLPNLDVKDPYHPANFFSQTNVGRSTVDERSTRVKEWMKVHSANYLTPKGIAEFKSEAARKAPDNAFGLARKETMVDNVKDVGLSVGQGALGAAEALTSIFGADNGASKWLNAVKEKLGDNKSAASKIDSAAMQAKIKEMEAAGNTVGEIKAYFNAFLEQPAEMIAQGIGSFATLGVGKAAQALGAGAKLARGINIGTGAVQGVGGAKSQQYESVKALAKEQGKTEAEAEALAVKAQEYSSENFTRLGVAGVLGAIASGTGIEGAVFGKAATGGLLARGAKGVLKEAIPEAAQEGQSKEAANDAAIRSKLLDESKRFQGVAGSAVQAGVIGGILGGGVDLVSGGAPEYKPPATDNGAPKTTNAPATAVDTSAVQDAPKPVATPTVLPSYEKARVENVGAVQKAFKEVANLSGTDEEVATQTSAIVGALAPEQRAEYERVAAAGHTVSDNGVVLTKDGTPIPVFGVQADRLPYQLLESEVAIKNAAEKIDAATSPAMRTAAINAAKAVLGKDIFKDRFSDVGEVKNIDGLNANLKSLWEALPKVQKAKNEPTQTPTQSTPTTGLPSDNSLDGVGAASAGGVPGGDSVVGNSDQNIVRPGQQPAGSVAQDQVSYASQTAAEVVLAGYTKSPNTASLIDLQATAKSLGITNTGVKSKKQVAKLIKTKLAELDIQAQAEDIAFEEHREQQIIDAGPGGNTFNTFENNILSGYNKFAGTTVKLRQQAYNNAKSLIGIDEDIPHRMVAFGADKSSARFERGVGIEINSDKKIPTEAYLTQVMVEEVLHAIDIADGKSAAHSSGAFGPLSSIRREAAKHWAARGEFGEFLAYGLDFTGREVKWNEEQRAAELFANLGVAYFSDKESFAKALPKAYEHFTAIFEGVVGRESSGKTIERSGESYSPAGAGQNLRAGGGQRESSWTQQPRLVSIRRQILAGNSSANTASSSRGNLGLRPLAKLGNDQAKTSVLNDTFATQGAQATLDTMAEKASWFERGVISAIRPFLRNVTLAANVPPNTKEGTLGLYMPMTRQIWLSPNASQHTVLHEMVHAAVDTIIHTKLSSLNARQQRAVSTLHKLYAFAAANPKFAGRYANESVHEFIAEAMSNQSFQVELNAMSVEELFKSAPTSMWDKFKDTIANVLGINNTTLKSSLLTTRALLNDLISAPIERQSESLALIGTTRQVAEQKKNNLWRRATEKMSTAFVDHGTRGLNQLLDERDAAAAPELQKATEQLRQTYILQDPSGSRERMTTAIALPIEQKIIELAKANGLDANELRRVASEVTIAQHSLDMSVKRQAEIDQDLIDAQATVDGYEIIENLKPEFKAKAKKQIDAIDTLYLKAAIAGSVVDTENINDAVLKLEEVIDEFAAQVAIGGGKEVISAKAKLMIKQSVRRAKSPQDLHTFQSDSRRLINAAYLVSLEFGTILEGKSGAERLLNGHEQESANWYAAQTQDPTMGLDGKLHFAGAYKLPAGMQISRAQQIMSANAADKDAALVNEVAEMYRQGFRELDKEAVKLNIKSEEDVEQQTMEYPFYVNTQGQGTHDPETNITESASRGFMSKREGSSHYLNSNDIFANLNLRIDKLAGVEASAKLADAASEYVVAGGKLLAPFNPHAEGTAKKNYITLRSKAHEPIHFAATTPELDGMFGSKPVAQEALQAVGKVTRGYGRLFTQATALFAPLSYVREMSTKTFNLRGHEDELVRADGSRVSVAEARSRMVTQFLNPANMLAARKFAYSGVETDEMLEFTREGGMQTFSDSIRTEADVNKKFNAGIFSRASARVFKEIHKYNQVFETAAVLASYRALKHSGMTPKQAAFVTLDTMNFRRSGKLTAQYMQPLYMFANASLQDTRQFMKVVVDRNGNPNWKGIAEVSALAGAAFFLYGALRGASDDDELGGKEMDALTMNEKLTSINIGGVKIPLGFGWTQTAWALGALQKMVELEQIDPVEASMESLQVIAKSFIPTGLSDVSIRKDPMTKLMQTVVPDLLAPALGVSSGKNFMGSPVVGKLDENKFKSEQGRWKTPEAFKDAALWARENLGIDMAPEQLKVISDGYFAGPIAMGLDLMIGADADKEAKGLDALDSPAKWESAIGISRWRYRSNEAKSVAHAFYAERDKLSERSRDLNSANPYIKTGKSEDFNSKMVRFAAAGATPEEIKGFMAMHEYEKVQRKLSQEQAALYTNWKDGGFADNSELTENARQVIESQKEFVMKTRGLN